MLDVMRNPPPVPETITWHACRVRMPDADRTVLIFAPELEDEPTGEGFFDGEEWRDAGSGWPLGSMVTWWAEMPNGPIEPRVGEPTSAREAVAAETSL